jgi:hypothetical protein
MIDKKKEKQRLLKLWDQILKNKLPNDGKAFENLILSAFKNEGAIVKSSYSVSIFETIVEQIDGAVHLPSSNISMLIECKNQSANVNIEPMAKLRNQLLRRPSGTIGSVFTTAAYTYPAIMLSHFVFPQTILLWEKMEIDYCLKNNCFIPGAKAKYRYALEEGIPNFNAEIALKP